MDFHRADLLIQYALAVAGEADVYRDRELGPIHLLKYVFLGDLAAAEAGLGSFTGAAWRFYKFGPWCPDVLDRIAPSIEAIGGTERRFASRFKKEDAVRYRAPRRDLAEELEQKLPWPVARAVRNSVRKHGNDTSALLHEVYKTPPMLKAAPGEMLVLEEKNPEEVSNEREPQENPLPAISKTKVKKLQALVKHRLDEKRRDKGLVTPRPPRYDDVFELGQQWLDSLAGEPIRPERGRIHFSDAVWKSPGRRDPELP